LLTLIEAPQPGQELEEFQRQATEKAAKRKAENRRPFEGLYGCLKDSGALEGDPAEIVKKWRDEWTNP
jgi:hypothetical protein